MTGFNISWYYEDQHGERIKEPEEKKDMQKMFYDYNNDFIRWINYTKNFEPQKLWPIIKEERAKRIKTYYTEERKRLSLPKLEFLGVNLGEMIVTYFDIYLKWSNLRGHFKKGKIKEIIKSVEETIRKIIQKVLHRN